MSQNPVLSCSSCGVKACGKKLEEKYPPFCPTKNMDDALLREALTCYREDPEDSKLALESAWLTSADNYGRLCRVDETIQFIQRMGYKYVGIAACSGLLSEAQIFSRILTARGIPSYMVCCKVGAIDKRDIGVPDQWRQRQEGHESTCNPILQAKVLEQQGTDFNVVIGLCVGHDTLFLKHSAAPCTVLIVKDRVMGHNPVAALYTAKTNYSPFHKDLQG